MTQFKVETPSGIIPVEAASMEEAYRMAMEYSRGKAQSQGNAPSTIGPTPTLDREIANPRIGSTNHSISMRDLLEGLPNALSMAAPFIPGGATIPILSRMPAALRVAKAGMLGFGGGGIRDMIRSELGEQPTDSVKSKIVTDALPAALGQGLGEVGTLASKALPTASSQGMTQAAKDLGLPAGPLSTSRIGQMYSNIKSRESVMRGLDEYKKVSGVIGDSRRSSSQVGGLMRDTSGAGEADLRARLGNKFDAFEAQFKGEPVDATSALELSRDLPEGFKGVRPVERVLGGGEVPGVAPFEDVRKLSKGPNTKSLRAQLEGGLEDTIKKSDPVTGPEKVAEYGALKSEYKTKVGDVFDRGVVKRIFRDPQQAEMVFKIPGSSPQRLAAVKKAIDSHPDPKVSADVWGQFRRAKFDDLMADGPSGFAKKLSKWDPESMNIVFGSDAPAVVRFQQIAEALATDPEKAKAFAVLLKTGQPPNFKIKDVGMSRALNTMSRIALGGTTGLGLHGGPTGFLAGAVAEESAIGLHGIVQNIVAHAPDGGLSRLVSALETAMKSGRTGPFWNVIAASARVNSSRFKDKKKEDNQ